MQIRWDNETTQYSDGGMFVTIRTGVSQRMWNQFTALQIQGHNTEAFDLWQEIKQALERVGSGARNLYPSIPEMHVFSKWTSIGKFFECVIIMGIVPTGARRGKQLMADYKVVIVDPAEVDDVLTRVFNFDKMIEKAVR